MFKYITFIFICHGHRKASAKTQVSLRKFLQSEVKIIHIIVQDQDGQNNNIFLFKTL